MDKPVNFTDLKAWQVAHHLVVAVFKAVDNFPVQDRFGLTAQMQRGAVSVTSNVAEGFSRQLPKDKRHFYVMARGSLAELQNQLMIARDVGRMKADQYEDLYEQTDRAHQLIHGLIRSTGRNSK